MLGAPHIHLPEVGSTNDHARTLAEQGAAHGTLVSADRQTQGRGRQGRTWSSPDGVLAQSLVLRPPAIDPQLLPLVAAVAVAELCGDGALIKWPNDIWLTPGRKVAGILIETRVPADWYVLGIGINVAVDLDQLDVDARDRAATLGAPAAALPEWRTRLVAGLNRTLALAPDAVLAAWRARDGLRGRAITWDAGAGVAEGIDDAGHLLARTASGELVRLLAGEVHLTSVG